MPWEAQTPLKPGGPGPGPAAGAAAPAAAAVIAAACDPAVAAAAEALAAAAGGGPAAEPGRTEGCRPEGVRWHQRAVKKKHRKKKRHE